MASVLHAKKYIKPHEGEITSAVEVHCRPTKIPVWTGYTSGSSSEDSNEQTPRIKSSVIRQSLTASRLPVKLDVVPGRKVDAKDMRSSDVVRPRSERQREIKECLSINQARCNEAIEQGLKQVLPGIMKQLLVQELGSKDEGLPKGKKQSKPRNNSANRKTSAQNIPVPRKTSTRRKLPGELCTSDSSISGNSIKTSKAKADSDGFSNPEPESVPNKVHSESEHLSDEKQKQKNESLLEDFGLSEPLIVPQTVQSEDEDVSDRANKAGDSLNEYILKYETDSDWLTDIDLVSIIKQVQSKDEYMSDREDGADDSFIKDTSIIHNYKTDSDRLTISDDESLPKQAHSEDDDVSDRAYTARHSLNGNIQKYEPDSNWLTEFDQDIKDIIKEEQSEDDLDVSDSQEKIVKVEDPFSTECNMTYNYESDSDVLSKSELENFSKQAHREDQDVPYSRERKGRAFSEGEDSLNSYSNLKNEADSKRFSDCDMERLPKQFDSESEDNPWSDCTHEYNYDADVDGVTDSEPESVPEQVQMESEFTDEEGTADKPNDSPSHTRLELRFESAPDDGAAKFPPQNLPQQVQKEKEALSGDGAKESSHSLMLQNLESKFEAVLDDLASPSGSDPECNIKNISSYHRIEVHEEEGCVPSESGSSIGSKLRRFSFELETDELFSTDSEKRRVPTTAELKLLSEDEDDAIKVTKDTALKLPSNVEKVKNNQSWEERYIPSSEPADSTHDTHTELNREGLVTAANETREKQEGRSCNETSGTDDVNQTSRGVEGGSAGQGGANTRQGSTAGGSGGDDPNDPKRPKPRKGPEDKKDRDEEQEKRKAAKRALINQIMGIASNLLQNKGIQEEIKTPTQILTNTNPVAALFEEKASQTNEKESVETLQKTIQSKDREIVLLQNLVDCCRKDYEELQESFNGYIDEFTEVDQLRDLISAMYTDNSILRHDNQKLKNQLYHKTEEAARAYDKDKKYKNIISKMEIDLDSLKSENQELSKKLKSYAATPLCDGQKDETDKEQESVLGKTCSLQDVGAMKADEENQALKRKLEQCEVSLKAQKKGNTELKEKLAHQKLAQKQLESKIQKLVEENQILSTKCSRFQKDCSEISVEEIVRDLRRLHEEILEARKDLASDNAIDNSNLKGPTLSSLSIELAEADDCSPQNQPDVNPGVELHTLTCSLTALTEELREQIAKSKVRLTRANSDNDYSDLERRSNEKMRELNEEIAGLHDRLDEDAEKFQHLEGLVTSSYTESDRMNEWIIELQQELSNSKEMLNQTVVKNDQKLDELKSAMEMKDQKLEGMIIQHQNLLEANDALRGVIHTLNMNGATSTSKIIELENYLEELECENEKLFKQLCEHKSILHKIQRENEEKQVFSREDVEQLHYALQNKTDSLVDILDTVNQMAANHSGYHDHPCVSAIENGLQLVYDVIGLLKAVGHAYMPSSESYVREEGLREPLQEETHEQELEVMVENLQEENKKLQENMQRYLENNEENQTGRPGEINMLFMESITDPLRDEECGLDNMDDEVVGREVNLVQKSSSEIMDELEKQFRDRQDSETELQQRANTLRLQIEQLKAEKSKGDTKFQALMNSIDAKQNSLEEQRMKEEHLLMEKLSGMEIAVSEMQKEKQNAEQKAHDEIKLIRQESLEKVTALEKSLKERSDSETMLENKVLSLEARIFQLNAEKAEREENIKTMLEALNASKNLEQHLREKQDIEKQLVKEVENLNLKISRVRTAKKSLRRELAKMHLHNHMNSTETRNQLQKLKKELVECTEREKVLHDRIKKLTEERDKAESMMEAQVTLIKESSEEKMEDLEELLRKKSHSEMELQEQKTSLERELMRLEKERNENTIIISEILRALKANQNLAKAVKDKCKTEKDYKAKLDEIEMVINKLKIEKSKPNCDVGLKEKYKEKYFELRRIVRKLEEDLNSHNKRLEELQTVVLTAVEDEDKLGKARESNLQRSIETLKDTLRDNQAREIKLYRTLQTLNSKIMVLENEKAEGEKLMKGLLRCIGGGETSHQSPLALNTGTDKAFPRLIGEVTEGVHRLRQVKQRVEEDLENFEKMVATARSENEVLQNQSFERILGLELSLKEKNISETELQERLRSMQKKVANLENEKHNADMAIQSMLESLKSKDELEKLLKQKKVIENELKQEVLGLEQEKNQNDMKVKFLQQQVHDMEECFKEKTTDISNNLAQHIQMFNANLSTAKNDSNNYEDEMEKCNKVFKSETSDGASGLHTIKQVTQTFQRRNHLEEELRQVIALLTKQNKELQEEKKACMEENMKVVKRLNNQNLELETANRERQKWLAEAAALKSDNLSSARNSRKLIEELTRREKELLKKIDEMKAPFKIMEERSQEMMELKIKIAELENINYEHSAKNKKQYHDQISESRIAKTKIQDLNLHLQQRIKFEEHLKSDIDVLNAKVTEMSVQIRNGKMKNVEIEKLYSMSKKRITELEQRIECKQEQIENLRKSNEQLRGQVVCLHEEKDNLSSALDDNYYLRLEQKDIQIKQLKNKLEEQEEKIRESARRRDDLTQHQTQMFMDTRGSTRGCFSGDVNVLCGNDDQRNTTKVIMDSLDDTERRIGKLKSSWKYFEEQQNRSLLNTSIDSINRNATACNSSYYRPSFGCSTTLV